MPTWRAAALALTAYTLWVLVDTSLKFLGASSLPLAEVIALMGLASAACMGGWSVARGQASALWPHSPGRQFLRALLDLGNVLCVVIALRHLPLSLFYILVFCSPMVTTLMAAAFLRERLERRQVLALATGFAGVVLAVTPLGLGRTGQWRGYLACLVCVLCFSTSIVWSRRMTQTETKESLTFFSGLVMAVAGLAGSLFGAMPVSARQLVVLFAAGLFGVLGSLCFYVALRSSSAATVSQFHYSQLVVGALLAWVLWHEQPTAAMYAGAALIIAAGLYTASSAQAYAPLPQRAGTAKAER